MIVPGVAGVELTVIACEEAEDVPHVFEAVTDTFPDVEPNVIVALVVPCPAVTVAPAGTVHVYEVAPGTAVIEYTFPVDPEQTVVVPTIAPGVAGVEEIVIA